MKTTLVSDLDKSQSVSAVELPFNFKAAVNTWQKYRISEVPLLVKADNGKLYDDHRFKGIFKNGLYKKIVNRNYVVLPNEEVDLIVNEVLKKHGKKYGLGLYNTHNAYQGDAKYWELRSDRILDIPNSSLKVGDNVQIGIVIRNSVGCNVSFGADLFSFRLVCQNGAIRKGNDLASLKIRHYGKNSLDLMYNELARRIDDLFTEAEDLVRSYRLAAKLKVRAEAAQLIADRVSWKYIPDSMIEVNEKTGNAKIVKRNLDFWTIFNGLTENIWHSDNLSFLTKADMTNNIHRIMENEIQVSTSG